MINHTGRILYKVFVRSYFKAHASHLLIFFTIFGIYFFFTPALKDSLLSFHERVYHNLLLAISIVSEPLFAVIFALFYLIFMISVYRHNKELLLQPENTFLYYSINSVSKRRQLVSWALAMALVSFPFLIFIIFSFIVGILKGYYLIPLLLSLFVLLCMGGYSRQLVKRLNAPAEEGRSVYMNVNIRRKRLWMMFLLHVIRSEPQVFWFSKIVSLLLTFFLFRLLHEDAGLFQMSSMLSVVIALSNSYLLYKESRFNVSYLSFYRNLPVSRVTVFVQTILSWILMLVPEMLFSVSTSTYWAVPFALVLLMFFRGLAVSLSDEFKRYIYIISGLFPLLFLAVLFEVFIIALIPCSLLACVLFYRLYYNPE